MYENKIITVEGLPILDKNDGKITIGKEQYSKEGRSNTVIHEQPVNFDFKRDKTILHNMSNRFDLLKTALSKPIRTYDKNYKLRGKQMPSYATSGYNFTAFRLKGDPLDLTDLAVFDVLCSIARQKRLEGQEGYYVLKDSDIFKYMNIARNPSTTEQLFQSIASLMSCTIAVVEEDFEFEPDPNKSQAQNSKAYEYAVSRYSDNLVAVQLIHCTLGVRNGELVIKYRIPCEDLLNELNQFSPRIDRKVCKTIFQNPRIYWIVRYLEFNFGQLKTNTRLHIKGLIDYLGIEEIQSYNNSKNPNVYCTRLKGDIEKAFTFLPENIKCEISGKLTHKNVKDEKVCIVWTNKQPKLPHC